MNQPVIVHVRRSIPGVADVFAFERTFKSRAEAQGYLDFNDPVQGAHAPRAGLYGIIVN